MDKILKSPFSRQCWVTFGVVTNIITHGCAIGYPAILMPKLREEGYELSTELTSWIASILGFALIPGNLVTPYVMERYGRKLAHMITTIPMALSWYIIMLSNNLQLIIIARFLQGFTIGMHSPVGPVIIAEYTSPKKRGYFLTATSLGVASGVLLVQTIGTFLSWKSTAFISSIFSFISLLIIMLSPETPYWLASNGKYDESRIVFKWLRGEHNDDENTEIDVMINARIVEKAKKKYNQSYKEKLRDFLRTLLKKELLLPLIIITHLYALVQFSALNVFSSYSVDMLNSLLGNDSNVYVYMNTMSILRLATVLIAGFLIKSLNRRTLLYISGVLSIATMLLLSLCSYLRNKGFLESSVISIILLYLYTFSVTVGIVPLPFALSGELFPMEVKGIGMGISVIFLSLLFFLVIKTAPGMFDTLTVGGTLSVYALAIGYCLLFLWFTLPETKDRTLHDIESEFRRDFVRVPSEELENFNKVDES